MSKNIPFFASPLALCKKSFLILQSAILHNFLTTVEANEQAALTKRLLVLGLHKLKRAQILLQTDKNHDYPCDDQTIAKNIHCSKMSVALLRKRFQFDRLNCLIDKPRSGRPKSLMETSKHTFQQ
jgi:hypothetical protein